MDSFFFDDASVWSLEFYLGFIYQQFKKWSTVDHWIDLFVDVGLIAFDVLSSPILILVRFVRYFFNKYVNGHIKRFLKWFAHRVLKV